MWIVAFGNAFDGLAFHGPFGDHDAAVQYGELSRLPYEVVGLNAPDPEAAGWVTNGMFKGEWRGGQSYTVGDTVTYNGKTYERINPAVTSANGNLNTLWRIVND